MNRVPFAEMHEILTQILLKYQFSAERAEKCARLFVEASRDGVYSHGLNRFPRFINYIKKGYVNVEKEAIRLYQGGVMEQWDGQLGPGNINAQQCMDRVIELAKGNGIGVLALRNTNHWMRGGAYGWQAAESGMIGICFTNTIPNMPAWGVKDSILGNNPLIIAVPREEGHIVLDTAMSQFSFGKIESYRREGKMLPIDGGFDEEGKLTKDPAAIEKSGRALPFGYWKGSGLSLMLDLLASTLSGGLCTVQIGAQNDDEYGLSQFFIAINPSLIGEESHYRKVLDDTISAIHNAEPVDVNRKALYPGERTLKTRKENMEKGIPVDESYWTQVLAMR